MTGLQKIFFGIGVLAIIGLGVLVYNQMSTPVIAPSAPSMMDGNSRSDIVSTQPAPAMKQEIPATPDAVVDDITKEIDADNSTLNDETQGETSQIEEGGAVVSDFGNVYDETK